MDVIAVVGIVSAIIVVSVGGYKLLRRGLAASIKSLLRHEYPGKDFIKQNRDIYTAIVETRALADSDRAYVIQFHNGHEFLLSNPVWKLTNTHEVVHPGVTYEAGNIQNILVSRVAELIEPIISGDFSGEGIYRSPSCEDCQSRPKCDSSKKFCSVVQVEELPVGFSKYFLEGQNIKTIIQCGLSNKYGAFGLVGIDFCGTSITDPDKLEAACQLVCQVADRVRNSLQYKKTPFLRIPKKLSK